MEIFTNTHPGTVVGSNNLPAIQGSEVSFYPVGQEFGNRYVRCLLGGKATGQSEFIETTGGGGEWEDVTRPFLPPLTIWRGPKESYKHKIPLLLEGFDFEEDQKPTRQIIEYLAGMYPAQWGAASWNLKKPPLLSLDGDGFIAHDKTSDPSFEWVIATAPEWGEQIRNQEGVLIRQAVTVTFALHTPKSQPNEPKVDTTHISNGKDTFEQIAKKHWKGKHTNWGKKLAEFNGAHNATEKLEKGKQIFFPDPNQEKEWARQKRVKEH